MASFFCVDSFSAKHCPHAAGNYLNAGNRNLAAAGFRVETLAKLRETRSTRNKCVNILTTTITYFKIAVFISLVSDLNR